MPERGRQTTRIPTQSAIYMRVSLDELGAFIPEKFRKKTLAEKYPSIEFMDPAIIHLAHSIEKKGKVTPETFGIVAENRDRITKYIDPEDRGFADRMEDAVLAKTFLVEVGKKRAEFGSSLDSYLLQRLDGFNLKSQPGHISYFDGDEMSVVSVRGRLDALVVEGKDDMRAEVWEKALGDAITELEFAHVRANGLEAIDEFLLVKGLPLLQAMRGLDDDAELSQKFVEAGLGAEDAQRAAEYFNLLSKENGMAKVDFDKYARRVAYVCKEVETVETAPINFRDAQKLDDYFYAVETDRNDSLRDDQQRVRGLFINIANNAISNAGGDEREKDVKVIDGNIGALVLDNAKTAGRYAKVGGKFVFKHKKLSAAVLAVAAVGVGFAVVDRGGNSDNGDGGAASGEPSVTRAAGDITGYGGEITQTVTPGLSDKTPESPTAVPTASDTVAPSTNEDSIVNPVATPDSPSGNPAKTIGGGEAESDSDTQQPQSGKMTPEDVKKNFGDKIEMTFAPGDNVNWKVIEKVKEVTGVDMRKDIDPTGALDWRVTDALAKDTGKPNGQAYNLVLAGSDLTLNVGDMTAQLIADNIVSKSGGVGQTKTDASQPDSRAITPPNTGSGGDKHESKPKENKDKDSGGDAGVVEKKHDSELKPGMPEEKGHTPVTICHATGSDNNPYVEITVDDDAVDGNGNGSADHNTDKHQGGRDIIPAGPWDKDGRNPSGKSILDNHCEIPEKSPTATSTSTETATNTPRPTETNTPVSTRTPVDTATPVLQPSNTPESKPSDTPTATNTPVIRLTTINEKGPKLPNVGNGPDNESWLGYVAALAFATGAATLSQGWRGLRSPSFVTNILGEDDEEESTPGDEEKEKVNAKA